MIHGFKVNADRHLEVNEKNLRSYFVFYQRESVITVIVTSEFDRIVFSVKEILSRERKIMIIVSKQFWLINYFIKLLNFYQKLKNF